mmetsp:Transcript_49354/g.81965  ORF Transcript_49354/g.81965 Transcript_49354/m.81965 type:complete len:380 (+) Transcript_49354:89-1228(+)
MLLLFFASLSAAAQLPDALEFRQLQARHRRGLSQIRALLDDSYVTSNDENFCMQYPPNVLRWLLSPPGACNALQVGLAERDRPGLVAFICALPVSLVVKGTKQQAVEVTLLCVHRKWRKCGLAALLISELRKRAMAQGISFAIYTSARPHGRPLLSAQCYHRPLKPRHLIRSGFWQLPVGLSIRSVDAAALPLPRVDRRLVRRMCRADVESCHRMFCARAQQYQLAASLTLAEFRHRFCDAPRCYTYVFGPRANAPAAFISFMLLPITSDSCHVRHITQAVLLGFAIETGQSVQPADVLAAALHCASERGAHVFNALALAEYTPKVLSSLGFGAGDGLTHIYIVQRAWDGTAPLQIDRLARDDGEDSFMPQDVSWLPLT